MSYSQKWCMTKIIRRRILLIVFQNKLELDKKPEKIVNQDPLTELLRNGAKSLILRRQLKLN